MNETLRQFVFREGFWLNKYGQRIDVENTERLQKLIPLVGVDEAVRHSNPLREYENRPSEEPIPR